MLTKKEKRQREPISRDIDDVFRFLYRLRTYVKPLIDGAGPLIRHGASDPESLVQIAGALWMVGEPLPFRIVLTVSGGRRGRDPGTLPTPPTE